MNVKKIAKARLKGKKMPLFGEFIPTMRPMYATYDEVFFAHGGITHADVKYDGYRLQIHKSPKKVKMFTRNENELNYSCYPDLMQIVEQLPPCIIEAELVAEGGNHKEVFDNVKKRFRRPGIKEKTVEKYLNSGVVQDVPLSLKIFETLRFERKGVLYLPIEERRKYTERFDLTGISPAETLVVKNKEELELLVQDTINSGHEGRICKKPGSLYLSGSEGIDWVKFKRSEPLDLVVVGIYKENYCEDLPFTAVLCATYNSDTQQYETIGKISVTRECFADNINEVIGEKLQQERPRNVIFSEKLDREAFSKYVPDLYIDPENSVVLEVKAMNLNLTANWQTCGLVDGKAYSMRIGYATCVRHDKNPRQATTTQGVSKIYELQQKGVFK